MTIPALRTPDERFENLVGWPFSPVYVDDLPGYEGLRMHYIDEGPKDAVTFLCLHGEPTWSYLYRKMAPVFLEGGHRVVAPDFFGFGRSDKPTNDSDYTYRFHRDAIVALVKRLDLRNVCLVVQDWGGIIGLTLPLDDPERYTRVIVMNTILPVGDDPTDGFAMWRQLVRENPALDVGALMMSATNLVTDEEAKDFEQNNPEAGLMELLQRGRASLSAEEASAYAAPFPDESYLGGVRRFPELVMWRDGDAGMTESSAAGVPYAVRARKFWAEEWAGASFMAIGMKDPVLFEPMAELNDLIQGCPPPMEVAEAGHFVQESGGPIATAALSAFNLSVSG